LGQGEAETVPSRRPQRRPWGALLRAPPPRLAIDSKALGGVLGRGRCRQPPFGPGAEIGFHRLSIDPSEDRVEGRRTGRLAGQAQGLRQTCPLGTPPLRHGRITPVPPQPGPPHQGQDRDQRVTLSLMPAEIRHRGQDRDERTRLGSHCWSAFIKAFWLV
jgi:hypothetical protein